MNHYLDDFDPDRKFTNSTEPFVRRTLHDAIHEDNSQSIVQFIRDAHAADSTCIRQPDSTGFCPIFVAVKSDNLYAVRTLISLGLSEEDLSSRENGDHLTALEALNADMRSGREFQEIFTRQLWAGYSDTKLLLEAALKRAMGHPMPATDAEWVAKKKWGCTCGKCLDGWLSPRTLRRLIDEADMAYDTAWETVDMEQMVPRKPLSAQSIEFNPILGHIPKRLWTEMYKTFILGYGGVMKAIAQLLGRDVLPTEATVRTELQDGQIDYEYVRAAQFYFQKGGRVEYALDAVTDNAKCSFLDLEGTDMDIYADNEEYLKTPTCDNDREFDIVRKKIGLDPMRVWGPYSMSPQQTHWNMDDSDNSDEDEHWDTDGEEDEEKQSDEMDIGQDSDEESDSEADCEEADSEDDDDDVDMEE